MLDGMLAGSLELGHALLQTSALLAVGLGAGLLLGGPLGLILFGQTRGARAGLLAWTIDRLIDILCRTPFVVMLVALAVITRGFGGSGAVPLAIVAAASVARLLDQHLRAVPPGLIETARAMGGSEGQIVRRVLLVEARGALVRDGALLATTLLSYAAIAGLASNSGVGALALRHGADAGSGGAAMVVAAVAALVLQVQLIDAAGRALARRLDWRANR